jgi:hypothetical protein
MEADGLPLYLPSQQVLAPGHTGGSGKVGATSTFPHNPTALRLLELYRDTASQAYHLKVSCPAVGAPAGSCSTNITEFPNWEANGTITATEGSDQLVHYQVDLLNIIAWAIFCIEFVFSSSACV